MATLFSASVFTDEEGFCEFSGPKCDLIGVVVSGVIGRPVATHTDEVDDVVFVGQRLWRVSLQKGFVVVWTAWAAVVDSGVEAHVLSGRVLS